MSAKYTRCWRNGWSSPPPPHTSGSYGAGGTGAGAARGGPREVRQEAHRSIRIPPRRSTVATSLQPSLSASSAVPVRPRQQNSLSCQTNAPSRSCYPRGPSIPPAWNEVARYLLKRLGLPHTCCAHPSAAPGCARKTAPRHACRRTPLIRVNCADAAAVAALPHTCSDCACLPVVPDKLRP